MKANEKARPWSFRWHAHQQQHAMRESLVPKGVPDDILVKARLRKWEDYFGGQ